MKPMPDAEMEPPSQLAADPTDERENNCRDSAPALGRACRRGADVSAAWPRTGPARSQHLSANGADPITCHAWRSTRATR
jgi:hypothetical protein